MTEKARLQFHSSDFPDQTGVTTITENGSLRLTFSPALSVAVREAERMAREAVEMGKGIGGVPPEGLALQAWGWTDELVMALAMGVPASTVSLINEGQRLILRVRHAGSQARLILESGEYDEEEARRFIAALAETRKVQHV